MLVKPAPGEPKPGDPREVDTSFEVTGEITEL